MGHPNQCRLTLKTGILFDTCEFIRRVSQTMSRRASCREERVGRATVHTTRRSTLVPANHLGHWNLFTRGPGWGRGSVVLNTGGRDLVLNATNYPVGLRHSSTKASQEPLFLAEPTKVSERLATLWRESSKSGLKAERLMKLVGDIKLWVTAYRKLYPKKGSMTPGWDGNTVDGTSLKVLMRLRDEVVR